MLNFRNVQRLISLDMHIDNPFRQKKWPTTFEGLSKAFISLTPSLSADTAHLLSHT